MKYTSLQRLAAAAKRIADADDGGSSSAQSPGRAGKKQKTVKTGRQPTATQSKPESSSDSDDEVEKARPRKATGQKTPVRKPLTSSSEESEDSSSSSDEDEQDSAPPKKAAQESSSSSDEEEAPAQKKTALAKKQTPKGKIILSLIHI